MTLSYINNNRKGVSPKRCPFDLFWWRYIGLVKSNKNKMIDGVCAGIAEYFNIDPTLVRLGAVVLTCAGGSGVLAYIICAIIVPRDPN